MNIAHWIEKWAVAAPKKTAIRFEDREISYAAFNADIKATARMLKSRFGIRPGDRIAYLGQNHPRMLGLLFAAARLGAICVPLNWRLTPAEHRHMLGDSGAAILLVDEPYREQCASMRTGPGACAIIELDGEPGCAPADWADPPSAVAGDDRYPGIGPDRPLLIVYTSGTTGRPKGAVLTQEAIQYNAFNSVLMHGMTSADVILTFLPLFHVGGLNNQTTAGFYAGATVILHRRFEPERVLHSISVERSTLTIVLPAHMPPLCALPHWEASDLSSLRCVLTGSTTIPADMIRYWRGRGIPLVQVYGATETAPIAIHQTIGNARETEGSIGFPAMHCEIRVVDAEGRNCAADEPGEMLIRGRNVMSHYWKNAEATAASLVDGWFHSGDIGYADAAGCYHFVDRMNDVIISGSENIYPAEVENTLLGHPDIAEAAVVGRADPRWGEVPVAVLVVRDGGTLGMDALADWLGTRLARYKHPRDVICVDALPRNEMRKVLKNVLRDLVSARDDRAVPAAGGTGA